MLCCIRFVPLFDGNIGYSIIWRKTNWWLVRQDDYVETCSSSEAQPIIKIESFACDKLDSRA